MKPNSLYSMIKKLIEKAGLNPSITPHSLRRSYATYQDRSGVLREDLKRLIGHADLKTTERYIIDAGQDN